MKDILNQYREIIRKNQESLIQAIENDNEFNEDIFIDIIETDPSTIRLFKKPSYKMIRRAVTIQGDLIKHSTIFNQELCSISVRHNGDNLQFIPVEHRTPQLCWMAYLQTHTAARYCHHQVVWKKILETRPDDIQLHQVQPIELCLLAIQRDITLIKLIRDPVTVDWIQQRIQKHILS